jgi:hypothetical protein
LTLIIIVEINDLSVAPIIKTVRDDRDIIQIDDCKLIEIDDDDDFINQSMYPRIHVLDINGTMLPMEQKPGESKYSIPDFVLASGLSVAKK